MMPKIVQKDDPVLRKKAALVPVRDIDSPRLKKVFKEMEKALKGEDDGVAIAAVQIGVPLSIFLVSGKTFDMLEATPPSTPHPDLICVNTEIIRRSKDKQSVDEGCLSVRWLYGKVERSNKVRIRAYDEHGKKFETGGSGLLAQIFQHEIDHLQGILFIDTAKELVEILPEKEKTK